MNEEIKFRAWIAKMETMSDEVTIRHDGTFVAVVGGVNGYSTSDGGILMQYTGLKDKNGEEIYQGDILKIGDEAALYDVKWRCGAFFVERKLHPQLGDGDYGWAFSVMCDCEEFDGDHTMMETTVVGNVHENPDLFKVEEAS